MSVPNGGDVAEQIVKVSIDGAEQSIKLIGKGAVALVAFLKALLESQNKKDVIGKTNAVNLVKDGHEISAFVIQASDRKTFEQAAKDLAIPFCTIKDKINLNDCNVLFRTVDQGRINEVLKKLNYNLIQENDGSKKKSVSAFEEHSTSFENSATTNRETFVAIDDWKDNKELVSTPDKFKAFLGIQAKMYEYSPRNQALIFEANPTATMVRSRSDWQKLGRKLNADATKLCVYKPSFEKVNGKPKEWSKVPVYDISDTYGAEIQQAPVKTDIETAILLDKLQEKSTIPIRLEERPTERGTYDPISRAILMHTNIEVKEKLCLLFREKAHAFLHEKQGDSYNRDQADLSATAIAYSLCEKYGADSTTLDFSRFSEHMPTMEVTQINELFDEIKSTSNSLSSEIDKQIEVPKDTPQVSPPDIKFEHER